MYELDPRREFHKLYRRRVHERVGADCEGDGVQVSIAAIPKGPRLFLARCAHEEVKKHIETARLYDRPRLER